MGNTQIAQRRRTGIRRPRLTWHAYVPLWALLPESLRLVECGDTAQREPSGQTLELDLIGTVELDT